MNFLPANYQAPKSSNFYMKLQEGENRIRILSKPIMGWLDWQDKKPVRYRMENKPPKSFKEEMPLRHFWAFIVFNYAAEEIQILEITQSTIRKTIESLCNDKDWGAPFNYDIKIVKTGEGKDTEYAVNPVPHKGVGPYIMECFRERPCQLEALFNGSDPFSKEWKSFTPAAIDEEVALSETTQEVINKVKKRLESKKEEYERLMGAETLAAV